MDIAAVDRFMADQIDAAHIPGAAVAITHGDQVVHVAGFGHDSTGAAVTAETPFRIASLSKSFTALAVMQLVDDGHLRLDDPVAGHLPAFRLAVPRGADITVRELLEQTSGMADSQVHDLGRTQPTSLEDAVASLSTARLAADPGTQWNYHNPNYQVAARLVEVVSGVPFAAYMRDHIFEPTGMTTSVAVDDNSTPVDGLVDGHIVGWGHAIPADGPDMFDAGEGGVVSTATDMAQWLIVQTNHGRAANGTRVLTNRSLTTQHTPRAVADGYALGWDTDGPADAPTRLQHTGNLFTYSAYEEVNPATGYGAVVLLNAGSGLMFDQIGIFYGVRDIVDGINLTPAGPAGTTLNGTRIDTILGLLTLAALLLGIVGVLRATLWARRRHGRRWIYTALRVTPLVVVLAAVAAYPKIASRLAGGRDVTWEAASYGELALTVLFCTLGLAALATLIARGWLLFRADRIERSAEARHLAPENTVN